MCLTDSLIIISFCFFHFDSFLQIIAPSGALITHYPVRACGELVQFWRGSCIESEVLKGIDRHYALRGACDQRHVVDLCGTQDKSSKLAVLLGFI